MTERWWIDMSVTLSQESYDAMLDDLKKLRERNKDLEDWFDIEACIEFAENEHNRGEDETLNIALRKLIRKAHAWDELKSQLLATYHQSERNFDISGGDDERGIMTKHAEVLESMDELDGEDDFYKMINKTEREE
ncbi:hypothetical protein [Staphylococcus warneri]|uniref:hypothetical protein n=1 Tax=Staphylococcus warneri TaxID=1292 RepID=UPI003EBF2376